MRGNLSVAFCTTNAWDTELPTGKKLWSDVQWMWMCHHAGLPLDGNSLKSSLARHFLGTDFQSQSLYCTVHVCMLYMYNAMFDHEPGRKVHGRQAALWAWGKGS